MGVSTFDFENYLEVDRVCTRLSSNADNLCRIARWALLSVPLTLQSKLAQPPHRLLPPRQSTLLRFQLPVGLLEDLPELALELERAQQHRQRRPTMVQWDYLWASSVLS